tara:strand:- start:2090 stop:2434 length:345 start_codon:yes stop_codon:yes gene_type:complete
MYEVEIKNLQTKARIGIKAQERKKFQKLLVSLRFKYSINKRSNLDNIKYLKDYSSIVKFLKLFVENSKYKSLERLVYECSNSLQKNFKIKNISICVNKVEVAKRYKCESIIVKK